MFLWLLSWELMVTFSNRPLVVIWGTAGFVISGFGFNRKWTVHLQDFWPTNWSFRIKSTCLFIVLLVLKVWIIFLVHMWYRAVKQNTLHLVWQKSERTDGSSDCLVQIQRVSEETLYRGEIKQKLGDIKN